MKILLVEPNSELAARLTTFLANKGVEGVAAVANAEEAVAWVTAERSIDVLITDVFMDGTDGLTLADTLRQHFPTLVCIYLSAYDLTDYADRVGQSPILYKPLNFQEFAETIKASLTAAIPPNPPERTSVPTPTQEPTTPTAPVAAQEPDAPPAPEPQVVAPAPSAQPSLAPKPAVAKPVAASAPSATPTPQPVQATPKPVEVVTHTEAPKPVAHPAKVVANAPKPAKVATPKAATPNAHPKVAAASTPKPAAVTPAASAPTPASTPHPHDPNDSLVGKMLGNYLVQKRIDTNANGGIYLATQTNMSRPVRLYTLAPEHASNPERVNQFLGNASVKANVKHPAVLSVFEAGEHGGVYFYACEFISAQSLADFAAAGTRIPHAIALQLIKTTASVMAAFGRDKVRHEQIKASYLLLDSKQNPRLGNIAASAPENEASTADELALLANMILPLLEESPASAPVAELLASLQSNPPTMQSWAALEQAAQALMPRIAPKDAYKLDARERAGIKAVEEAKRRQKRSMLIGSLSSLGLLAVALFIIWWIFLKPTSVKDFSTMIEIPAGEFIYQDGEKVSLPAFWIDEYEVTIGQYAKFLEWVAENPDQAAELAHPEMPKGKSHVPEGWADIALDPPMPGYYTRARVWKRYQEADLDVNSPVFNVDWYSAYAYANWLGRRLPTEQEWERAARGTNGLEFPWGNELNPKLVNSGEDLHVDPKKGGDVDGYKRWSPVDAMKGDVSPEGVRGLGGNVSEWTSSEVPDPEFQSEMNPVIRGGNWYNKDVTATRRITALQRLEFDPSLGFRTASDKAPAE